MIALKQKVISGWLHYACCFRLLPAHRLPRRTGAPGRRHRTGRPLPERGRRAPLRRSCSRRCFPMRFPPFPLRWTLRCRWILLMRKSFITLQKGWCASARMRSGPGLRNGGKFQKTGRNTPLPAGCRLGGRAAGYGGGFCLLLPPPPGSGNRRFPDRQPVIDPKCARLPRGQRRSVGAWD